MRDYELENRLLSLLDEWGMDAVVGSLCRCCYDRGAKKLARKLKRVYNWMVTK